MNLLSINVEVLTQHLPSIKREQLRHRFSQAAWICFATNKSFMFREKQDAHGNKECPRPNMYDHIPWLRKLLQDVFHPRGVFLLLTIQKLEFGPISFQLVHTSFLLKARNVSHFIRPHSVHHSRFSRLVIVDAFNGFPEHRPFSTEVHSFFTTFVWFSLLLRVS